MALEQIISEFIYSTSERSRGTLSSAAQQRQRSTKKWGEGSALGTEGGSTAAAVGPMRQEHKNPGMLQEKDSVSRNTPVLFPQAFLSSQR